MLVSTLHVLGSTVITNLRSFILTHSLEEVTVLSGITHDALATRSLDSAVTGNPADPSGLTSSDAYVTPHFTTLEAQIYEWMTESAQAHRFFPSQDFKVSVRHEPFLFIPFTKDLALLPVSVFPSISTPPVVEDGHRLGTVSLKLAETVVGLSSSNLVPGSPQDQTSIKHFAATLSSFLEALGHKEEFFVLGETSRQVARRIVGHSQSSLRRHSSSNMAVVLVDRTLDLRTAAGHSGSLLDMIYDFLPRDLSLARDVLVSPDHLFSHANRGAQLSLCHGLDPEGYELLSILSNLDYRSSLVVIRYGIYLGSLYRPLHINPYLLGSV